jgi:hypothetical protein
MDPMELDQSRLRLMKRIQERKTDLKNASLAIGRNAAYLHQFVMRGTPKVLPEDASALTHSDDAGIRLSLASMPSAGLVQMKGLEERLCSLM